MRERVVLVEQGSLQADIARARPEVEEILAQRYEVFCKELRARPWERARPGLDEDEFDPYCDHIRVLKDGVLVGSCRVLPGERAEAGIGFYSAREFDLENMLSQDQNACEIGRLCIAVGHRKGSVVRVLWSAVAQYASMRHVDVLFGCASFEGADPEKHAKALAYLYEQYRSPVRIAGANGRGIGMSRAVVGTNEARAIHNSLPELIQGYLWMGGTVSWEAVSDRDFDTTDVLTRVVIAEVPENVAEFLTKIRQRRR